MFVFSGELRFDLTAYRQERKFSTRSVGEWIVTRWGLINQIQPARENLGSHLPKHELHNSFEAWSPGRIKRALRDLEMARFKIGSP